MLRRTVCLVTSAAFLGLAGCGGPDSLIKEQIADMNALADAMEKGESEEKIKELSKKMEATGKKLEDLKLSEEDKKKLIEKHKAEFEKAGSRMMAAMMKKMVGGMGGVPGMPGGFTMPGMPAGNQVTNPTPDPGK